QLRLGDDDDALLGQQEAAGPVLVGVVADGRVRRDADVLVDDGPPDAAVPADVDAVEQDGALHHGEAVDADVGRQDAAADVAAGDDAPLADHAVVGLAAAGVLAVALVGEDELGRGYLRLGGAEVPGAGA